MMNGECNILLDKKLVFDHGLKWSCGFIQSIILVSTLIFDWSRRITNLDTIHSLDKKLVFDHGMKWSCGFIQSIILDSTLIFDWSRRITNLDTIHSLDKKLVFDHGLKWSCGFIQSIILDSTWIFDWSIGWSRILLHPILWTVYDWTEMITKLDLQNFTGQ